MAEKQPKQGTSKKSADTAGISVLSVLSVPVVIEWAGSGTVIGSTEIDFAHLHEAQSTKCHEYKSCQRGLARARALQHFVYDMLRDHDSNFDEKQHKHFVCLKICVGHGGCELTPTPICTGPKFECAPETLVTWKQLLKLQRLVNQEASEASEASEVVQEASEVVQEATQVLHHAPSNSSAASATSLSQKKHKHDLPFSLPLVLSVALYDAWDAFAYAMLTTKSVTNLKTCFSCLLDKTMKVSFKDTVLHVDMFQHRGICLALCKLFGGFFGLPASFRDDASFMWASPAEAHYLASIRLRANRDFASFAFQTKRAREASFYKHLSAELRNCKDLLKMAVWSEGWHVLEWASDRLRDDEVIVTVLASHSVKALQYASPRLQKNEHLLRACLALVRHDEFYWLQHFMVTEAERLKHTTALQTALQAFSCDDPNKAKDKAKTLLK